MRQVIFLNIFLIVLAGCSIENESVVLLDGFDNESMCNNYLSNENQFIIQSFYVNTSSLLKEINLKIKPSDVTLNISLSSIDNVLFYALFNTTGASEKIKIYTPDIQLSKQNKYYLKVQCIDCAMYVSGNGVFGDLRTKTTCLVYGVNDKIKTGYLNYSVAPLEYGADMFLMLRGAYE